MRKIRCSTSNASELRSTDEDVEKNLDMLQGVGVPLAIRPPFDALKP